jgi:thiol-disulfide isomerase/thioredoxin
MDPIITNLNTNNANIIGLYFSGEYCKYCKEFTPILIDNYQKLLDNSIDIIYVSSDKFIEQYNAYRSTQPWKSIPYEHENLRKSLREQYNIKTIPALLFFHQDNLIESDGRNLILNNCDETIRYIISKTIIDYDSDDNDF